MQRNKLIAGLALALALPLTAAAADLSWDYIDVRYDDYSETGASGNGYGFAGSKSLSAVYYVFGAYDTISLDVDGFPNVDADGTLWRVGMGRHLPINETIEGFGEFSYESIEVSASSGSISGSASDTGYGFRFGLRGNVAESLELSGGIRYIDVGSSDTLLSIGGVFKINEKFALTANYEDGDSSLWALGGRIMF